MAALDLNKQILEQSFIKPVVVDFWAPWCGPCRILGPVIEKLAEEQQDRWALVKVNTEEETELAEQYRIRNIPQVKMFYKGEVIAEFTGAIPRPAIEKWLDQYLPDARKEELESLLTQLESEGDESVLDTLEAYVEAHPDLKDASLALAKQLVFDNPAKAIQLLSTIHMGDPLYDQADDIKNLARFLTFEADDSEAGQLMSKAREAIFGGDFETAIQDIIEATSLNKAFNHDLPRKTAIALFRIWGNGHELTKRYRWRFDMVLY